MSVDVSAAKAIARAARFASSFEATSGPAGYALTRREAPPMLTDKQHRIVSQFAALIPKQRRAAFGEAVKARLSGRPGDGACTAACVGAAASDGFISVEVMCAHGLASSNVGTTARRKPPGSREG
jgi:hypothetical protein